MTTNQESEIEEETLDRDEAKEADTETPVRRFDIVVPDWIDQDITIGELQSIQQGGCASGAYMPAVTYHIANDTMAKHGDDVLEYIANYGDDSFMKIPEGSSWSGIAVHFLSVGVEMWASCTLSELDIDQ